MSSECAVPPTGWQRSSRRVRQRTSKIDRVMPAVKVMDPTHPLFGRALTLLSERCGRGKAFIAVTLQDGRRRLVLRSATDLDSQPQRDIPPARISARSLLPLARHVQCYLAGVKAEASHANRSLSGLDSPEKRSETPTQQQTATASAGSVATGSPQSARSAGRTDPAAYSHRGSRS
jgi:hypothetical protein